MKNYLVYFNEDQFLIGTAAVKHELGDILTRYSLDRLTAPEKVYDLSEYMTRIGHETVNLFGSKEHDFMDILETRSYEIINLSDINKLIFEQLQNQ